MKLVKRRYRYKKGRAIFPKDDLGNEFYEMDEKGNEMYPEKGDPFARDTFGVERYAKTIDGDEYFPKRKKKCIAIQGGKDGHLVIPRYASGRQKYPEDREGNQYYLNDHNGQAFPLRDENGHVYFARTKNGIEMIPLRYFNVIYKKKSTQNYHLGIDSAKNVVYIKGELNGRRTKSVLMCICILILNIPTVLNQILEYLKG